MTRVSAKRGPDFDNSGLDSAKFGQSWPNSPTTRNSRDQIVRKTRKMSAQLGPRKAGDLFFQLCLTYVPVGPLPATSSWVTALSRFVGDSFLDQLL